ncbi:PH domain-containing protein [Cellulomonas marina]|uniref:PH domain-containing protein n=1 Tax=Cellulomonas marina TaxID=988821 RepID=A0A1I0W8X7_9CELL|nr:PH domain-containing protein [Cellulomonas marina]GIG29092.1 hypothetical protein Cma02nite_16920 [Cellulomonas marina]SFA85195.1 PH domain-containing protein [Cellulomonas marina]
MREPGERAGDGTGRAPDALHAPFRPWLARYVATGLAVLVLVATAALTFLTPGDGTLEISLADRVGFALVGLAIVWFCWRQASVRAVPDDEGVTVRNLVITTRVPWAQVVSVRFGQGRPWVQLDLADGDTLAVMGIQRADGERATAEARRLATLVARHTATARDD